MQPRILLRNKEIKRLDKEIATKRQKNEELSKKKVDLISSITDIQKRLETKERLWEHIQKIGKDKKINLKTQIKWLQREKEQSVKNFEHIKSRKKSLENEVYKLDFQKNNKEKKKNEIGLEIDEMIDKKDKIKNEKKDKIDRLVKFIDELSLEKKEIAINNVKFKQENERLLEKLNRENAVLATREEDLKIYENRIRAIAKKNNIKIIL